MRHAFVVAVALGLSSPLFGQIGGEEILRGDANNDRAVTAADATYILNYLFSGGSPPACFDAADADDNGQVQMADAIRINNFLFYGGPPPAAPFPYCGVDLTADYLYCPDTTCD